MKRKKPRKQIDIYRLRSIWREQVMGDHDLNYLDRVVAFWLADHFTMKITAEHYRKSGELVVFCSQANLANRAGCDPADASRAILRLRKQKHLKKVDLGIAPRHGGRPTNEYLVRFTTASDTSMGKSHD